MHTRVCTISYFRAFPRESTHSRPRKERLDLASTVRESFPLSGETTCGINQEFPTVNSGDVRKISFSVIERMYTNIYTNVETREYGQMTYSSKASATAYLTASWTLPTWEGEHRVIRTMRKSESRRLPSSSTEICSFSSVFLSSPAFVSLKTLRVTKSQLGHYCTHCLRVKKLFIKIHEALDRAEALFPLGESGKSTNRFRNWIRYLLFIHMYPAAIRLNSQSKKAEKRGKVLESSDWLPRK